MAYWNPHMGLQVGWQARRQSSKLAVQIASWNTGQTCKRLRDAKLIVTSKKVPLVCPLCHSEYSLGLVQVLELGHEGTVVWGGRVVSTVPAINYPFISTERVPVQA
eukprot:4899128-Amphidinium_carterae.1